MERSVLSFFIYKFSKMFEGILSNLFLLLEIKIYINLKGERARVMQMKNQRFLFPDQQRTAEDDPLGKQLLLT